MITEKDNVFYCDCGFSFQRGRSGSHDCADGLRNKLAEYEVRYAALAAENAGLKAVDMWMNADEVGGSAADKAIENGATPEEATRAGVQAVIESIKTPATDAFLAEVRAQGVDTAIEHLINKFEGTGRIGMPVMALEWLAQELRKGAKS